MEYEFQNSSAWHIYIQVHATLESCAHAPTPTPTHTHTHTLSLSHTHTHSLHHVKRPGAILHPGTLVARLDLDDPSKVQQAKKFTGPLPPNSGQKIRGDKISQVRRHS